MKELYKKVNNFIKENIIIILIIILVLLKVFDSKNPMPLVKTYQENAVYSDAAMPAARTMSVANFKMSTNTNKKISQKFSLNVVVDDVNKYQQTIEELNKKYKSYIENYNSYTMNGLQTLNLSIKVPTKNVEKFLEGIKEGNFIKSENYYTIDYTETYSDNENRLKNLITRRDKLREMMTMQAKNLSDVLAVERELNNVQLEIERLEKSNMKIDKEVEYTDVNLTIEPTIKKVNNHWSIKSAFSEAINLLVVFCLTLFNYFIIFIVFIPVVIVGFILFILGKKVFLKIKK